jgi:hypothetical protein
LGHELTYILRGNRIYKKLPQAEVEAKRKAEHDRQMAELEEWKAELAKLREESIAGSHFDGWLCMLPTFIKVSLGGSESTVVSKVITFAYLKNSGEETCSLVLSIFLVQLHSWMHLESRMLQPPGAQLCDWLLLHFETLCVSKPRIGDVV